jgi:tetratricopeptide (TPR) repeat protein
MKNMMDGKSMKNMLGNITSMSDDQIRMYLSASGMGHISPQTFRQMAGQMNNMDENELERLKNMAPNGPRPGFPMNQPYNNSAYSTNKQETNQNFKNESNVNKTNSSSSINDYNYSQSQSKTILDKLERIKIEGNNFFRQGKYKEACEKYYEILNEMDYISDSEKITYQKQLEDMEMVCRLNIANTKIKQEDYDLVIHECRKVLKKSENFKAHYRAGIAYYKKGSHQKAYHHLMRAKDLNKDGDAEVERYLKECKIFVEELEEEKRKSELENEKKIEVKKEEVSNDSASITNNLDELKQSNSEVKDKIDEPFNNDEIKFKNPIKSNQDVNYSEHKKTSSKIEKLKEIVDKEVKIDSSFKNVNNKPKDDIEIEENTQQRTSNFYTQQSNLNKIIEISNKSRIYTKYTSRYE